MYPCDLFEEESRDGMILLSRQTKKTSPFPPGFEGTNPYVGNFKRLEDTALEISEVLVERAPNVEGLTLGWGMGCNPGIEKNCG